MFALSFCASRSAKNNDVLAHPDEEPGASTDPKIYCQWIKLEIESDKSTYKVGEPIEVKYKIRNATKNLTLQVRVEYAPHRVVTFKVRLPYSMTDLPEMPPLAGLPKILGPRNTRYVGPEDAYTGSYVVSSASGSNSLRVVPSRQFDMSEPRTYMVSAEVDLVHFIDDGAAGAGTVRKTSNTIEIKVVE